MRILIVDDESDVREWLESAIEQLGPDCEIIGSVPDGPSALRICEETLPDVVFVDVRMPQMDGLTFLKHLHKDHPTAAAFVLSSYADFDYARQALRVGALDYLLKAEITSEKLKSTLDRVVQARRGAIPSVTSAAGVSSWESDYLIRVLDQDPHALEEWDEKSRGLSVPLDSEAIAVIAIHVASHDTDETAPTMVGHLRGIEPSRSVRVLFVLTDSGIIVGFVSPHLREQGTTSLELLGLVHQMVRPIERGSGVRQLSLGAGNGFVPIQRIRDQLAVALSGMIRNSVDADESLPPFFTIRAAEMTVTADYREMLRALDAGDLAHARTIAENLNESVAAHDPRVGIEALFDVSVLRLALVPVEQAGTAQLCEAAARILEEMRYAKPLDLLRTRARELVERRQYELAHGSGRHAAQTDPVFRARDYMRRNFHRDISLADVAEQVGFSETYLSDRFAKVTGEHFSAHLARLRVEKACELLPGTGVPVRRIGEMVGYSNASYFSRVFRERCGVTPQEYRRQSHGANAGTEHR